MKKKEAKAQYWTPTTLLGNQALTWSYIYSSLKNEKERYLTYIASQNGSDSRTFTKSNIPSKASHHLRNCLRKTCSLPYSPCNLCAEERNG